MIDLLIYFLKKQWYDSSAYNMQSSKLDPLDT